MRIITERIPHPMYKEPDYDYMIMKLDQGVFFDANGNEIPTVSLNDDFTSPSEEDILTVIGFGSESEEGRSSPQLQQVNIPYIPHEICNQPASYNGEIKELTMFCAGAVGKDACQGDSGGPILRRNNNNEYEQIGIVSWGRGCGRSEYPAVKNYSSIMLLDYHAMTMDEPRNSPARRQQYLVICAIMAGAFGYSLITAGALDPMTITTTDFPGGTFYYKSSTRDYAATHGLWDEMGTALNISRNDYSDLVYALYLDNPMEVGGGQQRFATGLLFDKKKKDKNYQPQIIQEMTSTNINNDKKESSNLEEYQNQPWEKQELPSTKGVTTTQFPHTGGFVSALLISYRVIPTLLKKFTGGVVAMTCDIRQLQMCTFYVVSDEKAFWLNQPDTTTYQASGTASSGAVDWKGVQNDILSIITFPFKLLFSNEEEDTTTKEEL
mmetsp:Transcript_22526/g.25642  ORF Transcript_22526/g.25642 Transcript_22526/m.25642 type:complete len:437 (+) Transcript_22526:600-1910(+)